MANDGGHGSRADDAQASVVNVGGEDRGGKAQPDIALLAHMFVVVRQVVDNYQHAVVAQQPRAGRQQVHRSGRVVQGAGDDDDGGAAGEEGGFVDGGVGGIAGQQAHIAQAVVGDDAGASGQAGGAAVDGKDPLKQRRQQWQQQAVAGADVDAQAIGAGAQQGTQQRQPGRQAEGRGRHDGGTDGVVVEVGPRALFTSQQDAGQASEALVGAAQAAPFFQSRVHHGVGGVGRQVGAQVGAGAFSTGAQQAGLSQRLALARDLRLALFQHLAQFRDGQFLLSTQRQHPQPAFVAQQPEQVRSITVEFQHAVSLYIHAYECKNNSMDLKLDGQQQRPVTRFGGAGDADHAGHVGIAGSDALADEAPLEIQVAEHDGPLRPVAVVLRTRATPTDSDDDSGDDDLVTGFLVTEGVVHHASDIARLAHCSTVASADADGNVMQARLRPGLRVDWERLRRHTFSSSSCGVCGKATIDAVCLALPTRPPQPMRSRTVAQLHGLCASLRDRQPLFAATGAVHGAGAFDDHDGCLVVREDVGRHNAVDKVIGHLLRQGRDGTGLTLVVSGRVAFEIVQKALVAGFAGIVAVGAPTALAVDLARRAGLPLVGFVKSDRATAY